MWFSSLTLPDNWKTQAVVYIALAIVAIIALAIAYRAFFAHRLRLPGGGRARQSRLGLVDAFSLDGQRQLVLVRRDNVEHLVMIGGLNDVVIESQIIRVHAHAPAQPRDKEALPLQNAAPPKIPAAQSPAPAAPPSHAQPLSPARPQPRPEPPNIAAQTRTAPRPTEPVAAKPQTPPAPAPPRPVTPPPVAAPVPHAAVSPPTPAKNSSLPPPIIVASAGPQTAQPASKDAVNVNAPPPPAAKEPAKTPAGAAAPSKSDPFSDLDSLEAEMAKLLGRTN